MPFCALSFLGLGLSTLAVSVATTWVTSLGAGPGLRAVTAQVANVGTFGALWVVQFVLLDRVLFARRPTAPVAVVATRADRARGGADRMRAMTLRLRLVAGLVVLLTVGLAVFGVATYYLYRQLGVPTARRAGPQRPSRSSTPSSTPPQASGATAPGPVPAARAGGPPPMEYPIGVYGQLRSADGTVLATLQPTSQAPRWPATLPVGIGHLFTTAVGDGLGGVPLPRRRVAERHHPGRRPHDRGDKVAAQAGPDRVPRRRCAAARPVGRVVADPAARATPARAHGGHGPVDHGRATCRSASARPGPRRSASSA